MPLLQQPVPPLDVSVLQKSVQSLDMSDPQPAICAIPERVNSTSRNCCTEAYAAHGRFSSTTVCAVPGSAYSTAAYAAPGRVGFVANSAARTCLFYTLQLSSAALGHVAGCAEPESVCCTAACIVPRRIYSSAACAVPSAWPTAACAAPGHVSQSVLPGRACVCLQEFCSAPGSVCLYSLCSICTCAFVLHLDMFVYKSSCYTCTLLPARGLHRLAGRYENPMPWSTLSPTKGKRIWLMNSLLSI
jgi:hypothetical protein